MNYSKSELQALLNKTEAYLESCMRGLKIKGLAVTQDGFLVLTFVFGKELEEAVFVNSSWVKLEFTKLMELLLFKIQQYWPKSLTKTVH